MKILKSNAFWVCFFVIVIAVCVLLIFNSKSNSGKSAEIYVDGELFKEIPLDKDEEYRISTDFGENTVEVKDGRVRVKSADCKNQICVNTGWISSPGVPIICSPHRLSVEIKSDGGADLNV